MVIPVPIGSPVPAEEVYRAYLRARRLSGLWRIRREMTLQEYEVEFRAAVDEFSFLTLSSLRGIVRDEFAPRDDHFSGCRWTRIDIPVAEC